MISATSLSVEVYDPTILASVEKSILMVSDDV